MPDRIYTTDPNKPDFEFDATLQTSVSTKYPTTKRPVEDLGSVNVHVHREPTQYTTNGLVAWTAITPRKWQPTPSTDPTVMAAAQKALQELADKRQRVNAALILYTGPAVITSIRFSRAAEDGYSMKVDITLEELTIAESETTTVDPSRLRKKVKKKAKPSSATGQQWNEQSANEFLKSGFGESGGTVYNNTYGRR